MKSIVRLGDPLSFGGKVITASGTLFAGQPAALVGDTVQCAVMGHDINTIIEGCQGWTMNGKSVVVDGCLCQCGCVVFSTIDSVIGE